MNFSIDTLLLLTKKVFLAMGFSEKHAITASKTLVSGDIRGIPSHGISRLKGYVALWKKERLNATPTFKIVHETPSTALLDADSAVGLVSGNEAMKVAIKKATSVGTGWVAVRNSNHYGIAAHHAMEALPKNMIGISMTNASPLAAPPNSTKQMLGTNPISIAIPAGKEPPFVGDMATSVISNGKLENAMRARTTVPKGWVADETGSPSENPKILSENGSLLLLGGNKEGALHKGFILSSMVDILSGVLSGAGYSEWTPPFVSFLQPRKDSPGVGVGHFFGALRVDAFRPVEEFKKDMDKWIQSFRNCNQTDGSPVIIPGDIERIHEEKALRNGINIHEEVCASLKNILQEFSISTETLE